MAFIMDEPGREALLVQVSFARVTAVEALCVEPVESMHSGRQALARRFDQKVVVGAHEAPGVELPAEPLDRLLENAPERLAVEIVPVDQRAGDAARRDVKEPVVGEVRSRSPRHLSRP
jgi:hypothetical protein